MNKTAIIGLCLASCLTTAMAAERSLDKEAMVPASVDDVWTAWTTREGIISFFAPDAQVDARPGGAFHIYFNPLGTAGSKGADDMRYMALQPKPMLSFDWNAPPHLPNARAQRTLVIVRFAPVDAKQTRVALHHVGWGDGDEWDRAYAYFDRAWTSVLDSLKKRFESGQPRDWSEWMKQLRQMQEKAGQK